MSVFVALKYIGNVFPASAMKKDYSKFLMCEWCLRDCEFSVRYPPGYQDAGSVCGHGADCATMEEFVEF